jgi:hypothetical protein
MLSEVASMGAQTKETVKVTGLDSDGVTLISPSSPGFDALVSKLMANEATGAALQLKPYLVVVSNQSAHTVVAFDTVWKLTYRDSRTENTFVQFKYPDAVAGIPGTSMFPPEHELGVAVPPGKQRLCAMALEFGPQIVAMQGWKEMMRDGTRNQAQMYAGVTKVEIELDAVIFDDGTLVGPDAGNLQEHFAAYVDEKQKLFRSVVSGLDSGRSMDDVFAPIKAVVDAPPSSLVKAMAASKLALYHRLAAEEILGLRARIGDQAVYSLFKQASRKEPFVIHRSEVKNSKGE